MDKEEAYLRLLVLKYVEPWHTPLDIEFYVPGRYVTPEARVVLEEYVMEVIDSRYHITDPVRAMGAVKDIEPFSLTYEKYTKSYLLPELLFELVAKGKNYDVRTYFFRKEGDKIYLGRDTYLLQSEEKYKGFVVLHLSRDGKDYFAIFQKFVERPPYRGLVWMKDEVEDIDLATLFSSVKLHNLSYKKFAPHMQMVKRFFVDKNLYILNRELVRNPVLGVSRDSIIVETIKGDLRIVRRLNMSIDWSKEEECEGLVTLLRKYIHEHGGIEDITTEKLIEMMGIAKDEERGEVKEEPQKEVIGR